LRQQKGFYLLFIQGFYYFNVNDNGWSASPLRVNSGNATRICKSKRESAS
jgi:hypothetical protein